MDKKQNSKVKERAFQHDYSSKETFTYEDYLTWGDDERYEIIDGKVYAFAAAPSRKHQDILLALATAFFNYLKDKSCKVYIAPFDIRLPIGDENDQNAGNVVQPDLSVIY